ncbi:MAG: glycosyltransferase [Williamsia sp.]|nr:glycosyltransferase [Williamsia sp.]
MRIKNILIIGSSARGALENFYTQGLEKLGVAVETYSTTDQYYALLNKRLFNRVVNKLSSDHLYRPINEQLLQYLDKHRYDVILVFKGMELFPETIRQLKDHAVLTANYNPDHPFTFYAPGSGNKHITNSLVHYDVHFSYAKKITQQLQESYHKPAYCIPFGYNSNLPIPARSEQKSRYTDRVLFIGAYDKERARYLNKLKSDQLDIYGESKWKTRNLFRPYVRKVYRNRALYGNDYTEAVTSSMGILNLIRLQNLKEDSHNMRTFEVPGYGGLLITQRTTEQCEYFEENKEAIFFDSVAELKEKLAYLAAHSTEVQAMKQAAYHRSVSCGYSYDERSKQLLQCLEQHV